MERDMQMLAGDIKLLDLEGEDHRLTLILRADRDGVFFYKLMGIIAVFGDRDTPDPTEEEYRQIRESYNIYNDDPLTARTWNDALKMLDYVKIPWFMITPYYVHPSIAARALQAVFERSSPRVLNGDYGASIDAWHQSIRDTQNLVTKTPG